MLEMTLDSKVLYERIDKLRRERNWSVSTLARKAGISPDTMYKWKTRLTMPSWGSLDKICNAFEIQSVIILIGEDKWTNYCQEQLTLIEKIKSLSAEQKQTLLFWMKRLKENN